MQESHNYFNVVDPNRWFNLRGTLLVAFSFEYSCAFVDLKDYFLTSTFKKVYKYRYNVVIYTI